MRAGALQAQHKYMNIIKAIKKMRGINEQHGYYVAERVFTDALLFLTFLFKYSGNIFPSDSYGILLLSGIVTS